MATAHLRYRRIPLAAKTGVNMAAVSEYLLAVPGVHIATPAPGGKDMVVQYDLQLVRLDQLEAQLAGRGVAVEFTYYADQVRETVYRVEHAEQQLLADQRPRQSPTRNSQADNMPSRMHGPLSPLWDSAKTACRVLTYPACHC